MKSKASLLILNNPSSWECWSLYRTNSLRKFHVKNIRDWDIFHIWNFHFTYERSSKGRGFDSQLEALEKHLFKWSQLDLTTLRAVNTSDFARCDCQPGVHNKLMTVHEATYPFMIRCSLASTLSSVKHILQDVNRKAQNNTCTQPLRLWLPKSSLVIIYELHYMRPSVNAKNSEKYIRKTPCTVWSKYSKFPFKKHLSI